MTRARAVRVCVVQERKEENMRKRKRLTKRGSKRLFRKTAIKTHRLNMIRPMRGGERL